MSTLHVIAGIGWDPQIRGFLTLGVGVVVLLGSVYLLLVTNIGVRLGFLLAATAFWGWLFIMGSVWWLYGTVGMLGDLPKWEVTEVVYPNLNEAGLTDARSLSTNGLPAPEKLSKLEGDAYEKVRKAVEPKLNGWKLLPESNPSFGEAKATVDEHFVADPLTDLEIDSSDDYITTYSFERGGKEKLDASPSRVDRIVRKLKTTFIEVKHPAHYAIVQVHPALKQDTVPGQPPPLPKIDPSKPTISVIMERNLGTRRLPGAMLSLSSAIMFGLLANALHRRDRRVTEVRAMLPATTEA
jgi:hypothetical protein